MLGKRKRDTKVVVRQEQISEHSDTFSPPTFDAKDIFRRHFEATFAPLPEQPDRSEYDQEDPRKGSSDSESEVSEWSGLSASSQDLPVVELIDHATAESGRDEEPHRVQKRSFMSSRPPPQLESTNETNRKSQPTNEDSREEKLNLKHDVDLQRLLKESHLLAQSRASATPGNQRQMALDMRLQALGAKQSLFTQEKMPASHRIGMVKKAGQKEAKRRKDAKENGVILERLAPKSTANVRRQRGIDVPGVGKFAGGTLKLSRRDVASIQGSQSVPGRKGKRR